MGLAYVRSSRYLSSHWQCVIFSWIVNTDTRCQERLCFTNVNYTLDAVRTQEF